MPMDVPECPVCGSGGTIAYPRMRDRLLGHAGSWGISACVNPSCDAFWLSSRPTAIELPSYYAGYHTHDAPTVHSSLLYRYFWPTPIAAQQRRRRFAISGEARGAKRILEIGCGNGKNLRIFQLAGWEVFGQDLDASAAKAASDLLGTQIWDAPIDDCPFTASSFDVVLTSHVLEHIGDPNELLSSIHRLLAPGGVSLNFTPNISSASHKFFRSRWRGLESPRHLVLLGPKSAERAFANAGFSDIRVSTRSFGGGSVDMESVLDPRARYPRLFKPALIVLFQLVEDVVRMANSRRGWELSIQAMKE